MQPWIVSDDQPGLKLLLRQLGREFAGLGHNLWEMIGQDEPRVITQADFIPLAYVTDGNGVSYPVVPATWTGTEGADLAIGSARMLFGQGGNDVILADRYAPIARIDGGAGDDFIAGHSLTGGPPLVILGGTGDDTLRGGDGSDLLVGGSGSNLLVGGAGDDRLTVQAAEAHLGGETPDAAWIAAKALASDELHGGLGDDVLTGSYGADALYGGDGADWLAGADGADSLDGGMGSDSLFGGNGDDRLEDNGGASGSLSGGRGDDLILTTLTGAGDSRLIHGDAGADTITCGAARDRVNGGSGNDIIHLGAGDDVAFLGTEQGAGDDLIRGEAGNDVLSGGFGRDTLDGGTGADRLHGGALDDLLTGGTGADTFVMRDAGGIDTITDFGTDDRLEIAAGVNGLALGTPGAVAARTFLGDGFAWIDLDGTLPSQGPDGGHGVILAGMDAAGLSALLDHQLMLVA